MYIYMKLLHSTDPFLATGQYRGKVFLCTPQWLKRQYTPAFRRIQTSQL